MSESSHSAVMAVVTTLPDPEAAEGLASRIVEERLAACANLLPGVTSIFRWKGEVQRETEVLVIFKTGVGAFPRLRDRIQELHPYDVPEILGVPVRFGAEAYLAWVLEEVERP